MKRTSKMEKMSPRLGGTKKIEVVEGNSLPTSPSITRFLVESGG